MNVQDEDDWTPLHFACEFDNAEIVQLLLSVSKNIFSQKCSQLLLLFNLDLVEVLIVPIYSGSQ